MSGDYIPALRFKALTRFYDPLVRLTTREGRFKAALIRQTEAPNDATIIDLGCGTGTLAIALKKRHPDARVIGLDADPAILELARVKARAAAVDVEFVESAASEVPFADELADRIVSSLFFHHLKLDDKRDVLLEVLRVLKSGGELHIADWGEPTNLLMRLLFTPVRLLDGFPNTRDNLQGRLSELIKEAGAQQVTLTGRFSTVFGTLELIRAIK